MSKLRATQSIVGHMGFVWNHPSLVLIEIAWRWIFGIPFLMVAWAQVQLILAQIPPSSVGLDRLDFQNPWLSSELLAEAAGRYEPAVGAVLNWLLPIGVLGWAIVSGLGRTLLLWRMNGLSPSPQRSAPTLSFRKLPAFIALQGVWMVALLGCFYLWYAGVGWAAATHITNGPQPDLVGYLCWFIFLSLAIYVLWALLSWVLAMAPVLLALESELHSPVSAMLRSVTLGKTLSGKLMEVSLVLAIVKIMLMVLDMVFSAAPLPFADQFGSDALHMLYAIVFVAFLIGNDYFHVVRLRSFISLWRHQQSQSKMV